MKKREWRCCIATYTFDVLPTFQPLGERKVEHRNGINGSNVCNKCISQEKKEFSISHKIM